MRILLTNDDGIYGHGLRAIYNALLTRGHTVDVVAPMTEQSAVGHSITIHGPLRIKHIEETNFSGFGVHGTPTDCVKLAVEKLLPKRPDIIVSGINAGANVGPDVLYSGTVAAATEGAHLGFAAFAVSFDSFVNTKIAEHADYAVQIMESFPWNILPERRVINLNLPDVPMKDCLGLSICAQTTAIWKDWYLEHNDPRGNPFWWLDGKIPPENVNAGSDRDLLTKGYATLTPLRFDFTDTETMKRIADFTVC